MLLVLLIILFYNIIINAQSGNFINGVDVSFIPKLEDNGAIWYDGATPANPLEIFQQNNINYVRLRLWHTPSEGYDNLEKTILMAARIKSMGFKFLLNFHYSDTWADVGWQQKPAAWDTLSFEDLNDSLYNYTFNVIHTFDSLNLLPDMVQIGNEITNGFLQPHGLIGGNYLQGYYNTPAQWQNFTTLLTSASNAVNDAVQDSTIPIMVHIDNGIGNTAAIRFLDSLEINNVPFDIIGLSFYPGWHGDINSLTLNVNNLAVEFDKDIIVVETAFPWTLASLDDGTQNFTNNGLMPVGYPASLYGQYSFLNDLIQVVKNIPNGKGKGVFYWEPEWISLPTFGSAVENLAFFDFQGRVLGPLGVFREPGSPLIDTLYVNILPALSAVLNTKINTGNQNTSVRFQWDIDNDEVWLNDQGSNISPIIMDGISNLTITNLIPNTLYYYRAYISNSNGGDTSSIQSFMTPVAIKDTFYMNSAADDIMYYGSTNSSNSRFGETSNIYRGIEQIYKDISIPQNAQIMSAIIEIKAKTSNSGTAVGDVYSDLRDNPSSVMSYSDYNGNINFSSVFYQYSAPNYTINNLYQIDITNIIQDRINQSNWTEGDNLGMIIKGNTNLSTTYREITRAENSLSDNKLIITYDTSFVIPTIDSIYISSLSQNTVTLNAEVNTGNQPTVVRFQWDIDSLSWVNDFLANNSPLTSNGSANLNVTDLTPNTVYYYRAYIGNTNGGDTSFVKSFLTPPFVSNIPSIDSIYITSLSQSSVALNTEINTGTISTTIRFQWDTDSNTVWANDQLADNSPLTSDGLAIRNITDLAPNTTYYYRAYISNASGSDTSIVNFFTTLTNQTTVTDTFFMSATNDDFMFYNGSTNNSFSRFGESGNIYRGIEQIYKNISVPQNALISSAFLEVKSITANSGIVVADIYSDLRDNPSSVMSYSQFNANSNFSIVSFQYSPPAYAANNFYLINITDIIQSRVNEPDWTIGDNLGIILKGNTSLTSGSYREITRAENSLTDNKLIITYSIGAPESPSIDSIYVTSLSQDSVILNAEVNTGNQSTIIRFQWDINNDSIWANEQPANNSPFTSNGKAILNLAGLIPNTIYYYRAYISNVSGSDTATVKSFTTLSTQTTTTDTFYMTFAADDIMYHNGSTNKNNNRFGETSNMYRGLELIFKNISIDQGVQITSAVLEVKAAATSSVTVVSDIFTDLRNDPTTVMSYSDYNGNINFSSDSYQYSAPSYSSGNFYHIDITTIIQDRLTNPEWTNGNNLGIIIKGNTNLSLNGYREITRAENSLTDNKLIITYNSSLNKFAKNKFEILPDRYELFQNYPNPFNPTTIIKFGIPEASDVKLDIFNILGEHIITLKNEYMEAGYYSIPFFAEYNSSGIYIYRIQASKFLQTKKMLLIK